MNRGPEAGRRGAPERAGAAPDAAVYELDRDDPALRGRTGRGVAVAVIDSGVNPGHPHVGGIAGGVAFGDDGAVTDDVVDRLGHGTAVLAAIHEHAPDAELYVAKVFRETLSSTLTALVAAIDWAIAQRVRIVNLSLGTLQPQHRFVLIGAVERARAAGTLIVSARGHGGHVWYPGVLSGVAGVELDWSCPRESLRVARRAGGAIALRASGYPRPIPGVPPERNLKGISFAVANASGLLARLLEARPESTAVECLPALLGWRVNS